MKEIFEPRKTLIQTKKWLEPKCTVQVMQVQVILDIEQGYVPQHLLMFKAVIIPKQT